MTGPTVTITVAEYEQLLQDADKLSCLEGAGVDNWDGYDMAMEMLEEMQESRAE